MNSNWNPIKIKTKETTIKTVFPIVKNETELKIKINAYDEYNDFGESFCSLKLIPFEISYDQSISLIKEQKPEIKKENIIELNIYVNTINTLFSVNKNREEDEDEKESDRNTEKNKK